MSLVTVHRSPDRIGLNKSGKTNLLKKFISSEQHSNDTLSTNKSRQIDFDKEFNFRDLKEIYDESKTSSVLKNQMNKPVRVLKSASDVEVTSQPESPETGIKLSSSNRQLFEKYFVVKDAALILPRRANTPSLNTSTANNELLVKHDSISDESVLLTSLDSFSTNSKISNIEESTGAGVNVEEDNSNRVGADEQQEDTYKRLESVSNTLEQSGDILIHLKSMVQLLRPTDTISVAVKLCSYYEDRIRYLVVVETPLHLRYGSERMCEESAILGLDLYLDKSKEFDENSIKTSPSSLTFPECRVGLVIPIYANCEISLNGDGGFKFKTHQSTHIFKPVSIQAMWSAYQYLNKVLENSRKFNFYSVVPTTLSAQPSEDDMQVDTQNVNHEWVKHYTAFICKNKMDQQNEWYQKEDRSAQREEFTTPYFDQNCLTKEQEETGVKIREKLKEIMINSKDDYGAMSTIHIRDILERELQLNLDNFKKFVDVTIFQFYNQLVECASQVLPFLYLGTEWNASNYDSLVTDGITHVLNVSSDVDNFFPDAFTYLNIRVKDVDETDLLKEFDRTNKFIQEARELGTGCLVHCKMGVSRSASVVLAYLMKEYYYSLEQAFEFTKQKRTCINPNDGFRVQLATYESILNAHRSKYNLFEPGLSPTTNQVPEATSSPPAVAIDTEKTPGDSNMSKCTTSNIKSSLSVKEAINKIKSLSSTDPSQPTSIPTNLSPPVSPKQASTTLKRATSQLTTQQELRNNNLELTHVKSCPAQIHNVKKLAKKYMTKESQSLPNEILSEFSLSNQCLADTESVPVRKSARFSLNLTSVLGLGDSPVSVPAANEETFVPIGIVKRQVESINFNSRPCMSSVVTNEDNSGDESTPDDENVRQCTSELLLCDNRKSILFMDETSNSDLSKNSINEKIFNSQEDSSQTIVKSNKQPQQQTITRSPDSKRTKWELKLNVQEPMPSESIEANTMTAEIRSKKLFEFLADKQRKREQDSADCENINTNSLFNLDIGIKPVVFSQHSSPPGSDTLMSSTMILNISNNEITNCQTV